MRFIHIADVHLGAVPDSGCPWSASREKEIWEAFQKVVALVKKENIDLLLIAGDLFHRQPLLRQLREINYLFSGIPKTQVVWMAGNHDYMKEDSAYRKIQWAENVHGFFSQKPEVIYLSRLHTWVYGLSYEQREITERLYDSIRPNGKQGYHILLAHGGDEKHIPFGKEIADGFTYVALGHIHKPQVIIPDRMVYAGSLEPLEKNDVGARGMVYGQITGGVWDADTPGADVKIQTGFVPMAYRSYLPLEIAIHSGTTQLGLEQKIREAIEQKGRKNIYLIRLKGFRNPDMEFEKEPLYKLGNVVEIKDDTRPCYDLEKLKKQQEGTLIGEYIRSFDGKEGAVEQKALYYGLQALMEPEL